MKNRNKSPKEPRISQPAHPQRRIEPLPSDRPKPPEEDPDAPRRVADILAHPSYREADEDLDFLNRYETRGVRLQLDYFKPEWYLEQHNVTHTIVVFGSTRVAEPAAAKRKVEQLQAALAQAPGDPELLHRLAVAQRIQTKSHYYQVAREFGRLVGTGGCGPQDCRVVVMTGGGPGMMEAANRGAFDVGAKSVGLNISLPFEQQPNPYIPEHLIFHFHYFSIRKMHFLKRAKALCCFPGGYGTMDELFECLTLIQTKKIPPMPVVLFGREFWEKAVNWQLFADEGLICPDDTNLVHYCDTAEEAWEYIRNYWAAHPEHHGKKH